jgi:glucosamine-6-phosphate deaminase
MSTEPTQDFYAGAMQVLVFETQQQMGQAAAQNAAGIIRAAIEKNGAARVIFATGNSQFAFVEAIRDIEGIDWSVVTAFHMDEYAGMNADHPASFRKWIRERIEETLHPKVVHYLEGDAADLEAECRRYEGLLREAPIDLICMGIGENGHIAFNDPPVADFNDPVWVKVVELDEACRMQQVGEGHFSGFDAVPTHALSLTIPALIAPDAIQVVAPESRKADAVRNTLLGPISEACPASILRQQEQARLFLDQDSYAKAASEAPA